MAKKNEKNVEAAKAEATEKLVEKDVFSAAENNDDNNADSEAQEQAKAQADAEALIKSQKPEEEAAKKETEEETFFEEEAKPKEATPQASKYSWAKELLEIEEDDIDEEKLKEKVSTLVAENKKSKEDTALYSEVLTAQEAYKETEEFKQVEAVLNKDEITLYLELEDLKLRQKGYDQEAIDRKMSAIKERLSDDEDAMADAKADGRAIKNNARAYLANKQQEFKLKADEALKKIKSSVPVKKDNWKEVESILAASDTTLLDLPKFKSPEKRAEFFKPAIDAIKSGEAKKMLEDPALLAEFIAFKKVKKQYDNRLINLGKNMAKDDEPKTPLRNEMASSTQERKDGTPKYNAASF
jgi:hypothetical protein